MGKRILTISFVILAALALTGFYGRPSLFLQKAVAQAEESGYDNYDDYGDYGDWQEEEEEDAFGGILHTSIPMLNDVKQEPAEPRANEATTVTAAIALDEGDDEDATIKSVQLNYSVDGKAYAAVDMESAAAGTWSGVIPGQAAGAKVTYYLRVVDSYNNVTTEAPGKTSWDKALDTIVGGGEDIDNSQDIVPDDMDITKTGIGYNDEWIYTMYKVQGKIHGGTIDPPYIQIYGSKYTNPDVDEGEGLMVGKALLNAPLAPKIAEQAGAMSEDLGFPIPELALIDIGKLVAGDVEGGMLANAAPEQKIDGDTYIARFKRSALGENPSGYIRQAALTIANASADNFMPIPLNCSPYTQFYMRTHEYTVK